MTFRFSFSFAFQEVRDSKQGTNDLKIIAHCSLENEKKKLFSLWIVPVYSLITKKCYFILED